jgi:outer membrane protein assembly factor BamB
LKGKKATLKINKIEWPMKLEISMLLCVLIGLHLGCVNRTFTAPIEDPISIDTSQYLEVLWDSDIKIGFPQMEYRDGKLIVAQNAPFAPDSTMLAYDAMTGQIKWAMSLPNMENWDGSSTALQIHNGVITYNTMRILYGVIGIDLHTGGFLWSQPEPTPEGFVSAHHAVFGNSVYHFNQSNEVVGPEASFVRFDLQYPASGAFELLRDDNYESIAHEKLTFSGADFWVNPAGDTIAYYVVSRLSYNNGYDSTRRHLIAYNITTKTELWRETYIKSDTNGFSLNHPPIVKNNQLFVYCLGLQCRDLLTGAIKWEYMVPAATYDTGYQPRGGSFGSNFKPPVFENGKLYIQPSSSGMMVCIDEATGTNVWARQFNDSWATVASSCFVFEDLVIISRYGSIYIYNKLTGELLEEIKPEIDFTAYREATFDPQNGLLFVEWSDANFSKMRCFKVKTP